MNRAIIITIAGMSSRFRKSLGQDVLKAIYSESNYPSILDNLISYSVELFNDIYVVGGYQFDILRKYIDQNHNDENIILVENKAYDRGSNESLRLGILALEKEYDEVVFAEGDLVIDKASFLSIVNSKNSVVASTTKPITAQTSVIYYFDTEGNINYQYDTEHKALTIDKPFVSLGNSGQIWKFQDTKRLKDIALGFGTENIDETNLATIGRYFSSIPYNDIEQIQIKEWFNCNTINDYRESMKYITKEKQ